MPCLHYDLAEFCFYHDSVKSESPSQILFKVTRINLQRSLGFHNKILWGDENAQKMSIALKVYDFVHRRPAELMCFLIN